MASMPAIPALQTAVAVCCLFFAATWPTVHAVPPVQWKSGNDLAKALRESLDRSGDDKPIGESLRALSHATGVASLLDRRVDPERLVTIEAHGIALGDEFKRLAHSLQLGVGAIGSVQYLGPKATAARVEALSELRRQEAVDGGGKAWLKTAPSGWDDLAEPRQLAQTIAADASATILNPEAIPHDVWAAWSGPPLAHSDRLTLVLAGFDLTFELRKDGTEVQIIPAPEQLTFERTYQIAGTTAPVMSELKRLLPEVKVKSSGAKALRVTANAEQHAQIAELIAGKPSSKTVVVPGEKVYTFKAENQLIGAMVQTLAKERGLKVQASEAIVAKLKQRGSVQVEKASFEEALKKVLDPVGISFKLTDKSLELSD